MENIKKAMSKLGVIPKLRLGILVPVEGKDKNGKQKMGIKSTGPHLVTFIDEPALVNGKNFEGNPRQEFKLLVEWNGEKYRWMVPLLNREGQPNYLLERLADVKPGDKRILEMLTRGAAKYIDVREEDGTASTHDPDEMEYEEDEEVALAKALENEGQIDNHPF